MRWIEQGECFKMYAPLQNSDLNFDTLPKWNKRTTTRQEKYETKTGRYSWFLGTFILTCSKASTSKAPHRNHRFGVVSGSPHSNIENAFLHGNESSQSPGYCQIFVLIREPTPSNSATSVFSSHFWLAKYTSVWKLNGGLLKPPFVLVWAQGQKAQKCLRFQTKAN